MRSWFAYQHGWLALKSGKLIAIFAILASSSTAIAAPHPEEAEVQLVEQIDVTANQEMCVPTSVHRPDPNVAYRPGIGRNGRYVAPADLNTNSTINLPDSVEMDILVSPYNEMPVEVRGNLGRIKTDLITGTTTVFGQKYHSRSPSKVCP